MGPCGDQIRRMSRDGVVANRGRGARSLEVAVAVSLAALIVMFVLAGLPGTAIAAWEQPVAGQLNTVGTAQMQPVIRQVGSNVYAAGIESSGASNDQLLVRVLKPGDSTWRIVGTKLNFADNASPSSPSIADVGGVPYVAWQEQDQLTGVFQVYVKRLAQSPAPDTWESVGASLNLDPARNAIQPDIENVAGVAHVAFAAATAAARKVYVVKDTGASWSPVGGSLIFDALRDALKPNIFPGQSDLVVGWIETLAAENDIRVSRYDASGDAWVPRGSQVNQPDGDARGASYAVVDGKLTAAITVFAGGVDKLIVKQFTTATSSWDAIGAPLNATTGSAAFPSIIELNGQPWVAHREVIGGIGRILLSRFDAAGAEWEVLPAFVGPNPAGSAMMTAVAGVPWVAVLESGANSAGAVWRLVPTLGSLDVDETNSSALVKLSVTSFGLPFSYTVRNRALDDGSAAINVPSGELPYLATTFTGLDASSAYSVSVLATDELARVTELSALGYATAESDHLADEEEPTVQLTWSPKSKKPPRIRGSASDSGGTVARVEVALGVARGATNCFWLLDGNLSAGDCVEPQWQNAVGTNSFSLPLTAKLRKKLMTNAYEVYARSFDAAGNVSDKVAYRCGRYVKSKRRTRGKRRARGGKRSAVRVSRCVAWA